MKCIKNNKTNEVRRVEDIVAQRKVGSTWSYVPKSEWKAVTRVTPTISVEEKVEKKQKLTKKAVRRSKFKEKV